MRQQQNKHDPLTANTNMALLRHYPISRQVSFLYRGKNYTRLLLEPNYDTNVPTEVASFIISQ